MSEASDDPAQNPVAEPVTQTNRPPVPARPVPSDAVPAESGPPAVADPVTGQLDLRDYPPRVPGAERAVTRRNPDRPGHDR